MRAFVSAACAASGDTAPAIMQPTMDAVHTALCIVAFIALLLLNQPPFALSLSAPGFLRQAQDYRNDKLSPNGLFCNTCQYTHLPLVSSLSYAERVNFSPLASA